MELKINPIRPFRGDYISCLNSDNKEILLKNYFDGRYLHEETRTIFVEKVTKCKYDEEGDLVSCFPTGELITEDEDQEIN